MTDETTVASEEKPKPKAKRKVKFSGIKEIKLGNSKVFQVWKSGKILGNHPRREFADKHYTEIRRAAKPVKKA